MSREKTLKYYERLSSRLGYQFVLGGHRHFGWYKGGQHKTMIKAAEAMIDHLADFSGIVPGSNVLDAGCGQGRSALQLAKKYGATVSGVDLVPRSIAFAKHATIGNKSVNFQIADYNKLPFEDNSFDVVFALETFTHSSDPERTIREFLRVLKPGGRIAIFDYSIAPLASMPHGLSDAIHLIAKETDCPGFDTITHGYYEDLLPKLKVSSFEVVNATEGVIPGIKNMYRLSWLPYHLLKIFKHQNDHPNLLMAHIGWQAGVRDYIRYINVKIVK
jgi:ubiquinone/menaquinone biosynthesis C-methylase UbiE